MNEEFCVDCGQQLVLGMRISSIFIAHPKPVKFEDGYRCEKCARVRVESKRKSVNK